MVAIVSALMENIVEAAAAYYGVSTKSIRSRTRSRIVSRARQLAIYLARILTSYSLAELGTYFDGRNHATINFSYHKVQVKIRLEPDFAREVEKIRRTLAETWKEGPCRSR